VAGLFFFIGRIVGCVKERVDEEYALARVLMVHHSRTWGQPDLNEEGIGILERPSALLWDIIMSGPVSRLRVCEEQRGMHGRMGHGCPRANGFLSQNLASRGRQQSNDGSPSKMCRSWVAYEIHVG
jgi:hypothetical protein